MSIFRSIQAQKMTSLVLTLCATAFCVSVLAKDAQLPSGFDGTLPAQNSTEAAAAGSKVENPPLMSATLIGSFFVSDGQNHTSDPPTYSCVEACATVFGGAADDYFCSTSGDGVNHLAWASTWGGTPNHCVTGTPVDETFKLSTNYGCGSTGCSISAYVDDWCVAGASGESENFCYASAESEPVPGLNWWGMAGAILLIGLTGFMIRRRLGV